MSAALLLAAAVMALTSRPLRAEPLAYQLHGFASQGYALSSGNNFIGNSTGDGSFEFTEIGVNGTAAYGPLRASLQLLSRNVGSQDDGDIKLDYGFVDYRVQQGAQFGWGLRLGRVKNPFGLFNDTRDVVFTRPGIVLPSSVYFEGSGVRNLLFASDGGQLYATAAYGAHLGSLIVTVAPDFALDDDQKRALTGGTAAFDVDVNNMVVARFLDEWDGATRQLGLTYTHAQLVAGPPFSGSFDIDIYVLSARFGGERYELTSEYSLTRSRGAAGGQPVSTNTSDGFYLQADWHLRPAWTTYVRGDFSFSDRNDRDGSDYAAETGGDADSRYARDYTLGLKWLPDAHWGIWAEYHFIQGTATVPIAENPGRSLEADSDLLLLMLGYRF